MTAQIRKALFLVLVCLVPGRLDAQTGRGVPELSAAEQSIQSLIGKYRLPGAALAIARGGKLIYARGFGYADLDRRIPVQPAALFRIGSISKPITAVTLLRLQEQHRLNLDDRVFDLLSEYKDVLGDPRMLEISVRQLLHHTAGWDPERSGDPLFPEYGEIAAAGGGFPPAQSDVIRYWLSQPLDDSPGTVYHYSNFGFLLAGRVIEKVTGLSYGEAVRQFVLQPQGITHMRLGRALEGQAAPTEAHYYDSLSRSMVSIYSEVPRTVPAPYGGFSMTLVDSAGGWIASAPDLVRLFTAIDNSRTRLLQKGSFQQFVEHPAGLPHDTSWNGLGIGVAEAAEGYTLFHNGGIPGTYGLVVSLSGSTTFAFLTNTNPSADDPTAFESDLISTLMEGLAAVDRWPAGDQFPAFYPARAPVPTLRAESNAASQSSGVVSPGEVVSFGGYRLGPGTGAAFWREGGRIASELAGVRVYFDDVAAPLLFVQNRQINAIAPFGLDRKTDTAVTVDNNGVWTAPFSIAVAPANPAVFQCGDGHPAPRGSVVTLYATGLGVLVSPVEDGAIAHSTDPKLAQALTVTLAGRPVEVLYAGPVPGMVYGIFQINIRVPEDSPTGALPLVIRSGDAVSPDGVSLVVR